LWNAQLNNLEKDISYQIPAEFELSAKPLLQAKVQFTFATPVGLKDVLHDPSSQAAVPNLNVVEYLLPEFAFSSS